MMHRNTITRGDMRHRWEINVTPFVTAARAGATRARHVARREWARSHRRERWRRRRWLMMAGGVAIIGAVGGIIAAMARRSEIDMDISAAREEARAAGRSGMETAREQVGAARDMTQKLRHGNSDRPGPGEKPR